MRPHLGSMLRLALALTLSSYIAAPLASPTVAKTLRWAIQGAVEPIHQEMAKKFKSKYSGWDVLPVAYSDQSELLDMMLDRKPDVITMSTKIALEYIDIGVLTDIRPFYKSNDKFYNEVMKAFAKNLTKGGKTYALPFWGNMATLNFNKGLFSGAGLPLPQPSWKYEGEFYTSLRKLTKDANGDGRPEQYGMVGGVHNEWLPVFYSWGAEFLSFDGLKLLFTDKAALDSLTFVNRLHTERLAEARNPDEEFAPANGPFIDGRTAMIMSYRRWDNDYIKRLAPNRRMDVSYTSTPHGKKGNISVAQAQAIGIYVQAPNKDGAANFIKFLFDIENQIEMYKAGGGFPTRKNAFRLARAGQSGKARQADPIADAYERARVMGADEISQIILASVNQGIYEMVHQGYTPAQLIQQAKDEFFNMMKGRTN